MFNKNIKKFNMFKTDLQLTQSSSSQPANQDYVNLKYNLHLPEQQTDN